MPQTVNKIDPEFFRKAFECLDIGMMIHDEQRTILAFNSAAARVTGFTREEAMKSDCRSLFNPVFCDKSCGLCKTIESGQSKTDYETQIITKNGEAYWIRLDSFPFQHNDKTYFVVLFKDVTEVRQLREQVAGSHSFYNIVGKSEAIKRAFDFIRNVSETDITVLIIGETGSGKELAASAMHNHSPRKGGPFIKVNCAALPEHLIESELFGHVKGSFTGATRDRVGRFEAAGGGTIFLDEIGDVSPSFQAKLLRVLQELEIERVGDHKPIKVDVRIVAATNKDLLAEAKKGNFREDLYYRLAGAVLNLPPLRERRDDIPLLVGHFLKTLSEKHKRSVDGVTPELMNALVNYDWPGNIRELYNIVENGVAMCKKKTLTLECVSPGCFEQLKTASTGTTLKTEAPSPAGASEKDRIIAALEASKFKVGTAAKTLGMSRTTLWRKMKALGIE